MSVYEKLRDYIDNNGLTPSRIASDAGIPGDLLTAILGGKKKLTADDLRSICLALNITPEAFVY